MLINHQDCFTTYRSHPSRSPCSSSDAASSSTYSSANTRTSTHTSSSATSASPCPPPCPFPEDLDIELETDLLVAVCAVRNDTSHPQESEGLMTQADIWMTWEDNAAYIQIGQGHMDEISKIEDEEEFRRAKRRKERKIRTEKKETKYYDFMADVRATTRIKAPIDDWGCDNLDDWSTSVASVNSEKVRGGNGDDIWRSRSLVKKEITVESIAVEIPAPSPNLPQDSAKCEIRHIPGKGLGVVATTNIAQGQTIVTESPFLMVDHPPNLQQVRSRLSKLPIDLENLFHTFNPSLSPHHANQLVDVIATNVIPLVDEPLVDLASSRPSVESITAVNQTLDGRVLRALRPIANQEEITACYLQDTAMSHKDRQQALYETWRFVCTCPICSLSLTDQSIENDRRKRFRMIRDEYIGLDKEDTWQREGLTVCSAKIKKAIKLLEEGGQEGEIADCRWSFFILSARWGDEEKARREGSAWLRQVTKMGDDPGKQYHGLVRKPRTTIDWGMYDDDRSGEESECDTDDDFGETHRKFKKVRLRAATMASSKTVSRNSRRSATMAGTR